MVEFNRELVKSALLEETKFISSLIMLLFYIVHIPLIYFVRLFVLLLIENFIHARDTFSSSRLFSFLSPVLPYPLPLSLPIQFVLLFLTFAVSLILPVSAWVQGHLLWVSSFSLRKTDSPSPSSLQLPLAAQEWAFLNTSALHAGAFVWLDPVHAVTAVVSQHAQLSCRVQNLRSGAHTLSASSSVMIAGPLREGM